MGRVLDGKWITQDLGADAQGRYVRRAAQFRNRLSADGSTGFAAEPGRYHLYLSAACPWCHRVLLTLKLKGLDHAFTYSWAEPYMGENGWTFAEGADEVLGVSQAWQVFVAAQPDYTGRASVPILWDKQTNTVVTNESTDIVLSLDRACNNFALFPEELWPEARHDEINAVIQASYGPVNNGVYRAGFAGNQQAHTEAVAPMFARLDEIELILSRSRYLMGESITAADVCLFPTIFRFDAVYYIHFKCSLRQIRDYPNLWGWARDMYQTAGIAQTCDIEHAKQHYYTSHESIHPRRYVPLGPDIDWNEPHGRRGTLR